MLTPSTSSRLALASNPNIVLTSEPASCFHHFATCSVWECPSLEVIPHRPSKANIISPHRLTNANIISLPHRPIKANIISLTSALPD